MLNPDLDLNKNAPNFSLQLETTGPASLLVDTLQMILLSERVAHLNLKVKMKFRIPDSDKQSRRDAEDIPLEEIRNAAMEIMVQQISLPKEDLIREVARLMGFQRSGPAINEHFKLGINLLVKSGQAVRDKDERIILKG
ncbi:MAG: hypothetical protein ABFD04_10345 [Syntrophomonas sp.]